MSRLDRKLLRDLRRLGPQLVAAALVLAAGLAMLVMAAGLVSGLREARADFYAEARMADLGAGAVRAPASAAARIRGLPGVAAAEDRVSGFALLDLRGVAATLSARVLSLPEQGRPSVNDIVLAAGRRPDPWRLNEAVINSAFAKANGIAPGAELPALIKGRRVTLEIVGVADSPEFVFIAPPGEVFPQPDRFGVIWMGRRGLERALELDGAFNDVVLRLAPGAREAEVATQIDAILAPFGGQGAYGRDRMISDRFLREEIAQLTTMSWFLPSVFLLVAGFLVNVTLSRMVATERGNIGLLKSFGFSGAAIGGHYAKLALAVAALGTVLGLAFGGWLGLVAIEAYRTVYRFPALDYSLEFGAAAVTAAIGFGACLLGAAGAVRRAVRLAPAIALSPPAPMAFRGLGPLDRWVDRLDARSRIIARRILRFPRRAATTVLGVSFALALLTLASTFPAAMREMLRVNFELANRQDATLTFAEARGADALSDVMRLPGVLAAEPVRIREAVFQVGASRVREALIGLPEAPQFSRLLDQELKPLTVQGDGLTLSRRLAEKLGVEAGDMVRVEATDGRRRAVDLPVARIADTWLGGSAYMEIEAMGRVFMEPNRASAAHVLIDPSERARLDAAVKETPAIVAASFTADARASQEALFQQGAGFTAGLFTAFAGLMAVGVAFSAARITLSEQERDLATLRVLGFSKGECMVVVLGEVALLTVLAAPLGLVLGYGLSASLMKAFETDLFTLPLVVDPTAYAGAAAFVLACAAAAAAFVARGALRLDPTESLKARS